MLKLSRRAFLKKTALFTSLGLAPHFLGRTAAAVEPALSPDSASVLVVVQLGGGNDGLNTIVPWNDDAYYRARPTLALGRENLLRINDDCAMNGRMSGLMRLWDAGQLAIVQGVGYPNPDRSHFRSMEIWHTASDADEYLGYGWLGRYFDNCCSGAPVPQIGVAVDAQRPQAFEGTHGLGIATTDPVRFGWMPGSGADTVEAFKRINAPDGATGGALDFLRHTTVNTLVSSAEVREAARRGGVEERLRPRRDLPLDVVAGLIRGGLSTRVYYVSMSGFDTHTNQANQQDRLLGQFSDNVAAFERELERDGNAARVVTLVFSEFGRRVAENGGGGTDHGTAAPMFLIGPRVKPGLHGAAPSLDNLDDGDLRHTADFRGVYTAVLEDWLGTDAAQVLGKRFEKPALLA